MQYSDVPNGLGLRSYMYYCKYEYNVIQCGVLCVLLLEALSRCSTPMSPPGWVFSHTCNTSNIML